MKTLRLICIILLLSVPASARMGLMQLAGGDEVGAPADTYSDIWLWWRAEAFDFTATSGTLDYAVTDTTATNNSCAINADAGLVGTNGLDSPTTSAFVSLTVANTVDAEGSALMKFRVTTWAARNLFTLYEDANNRFYCALAGADEVYCRWRVGSTDELYGTSTTANLSTGTIYTLEAKWDEAANVIKVYIDDVEVLSLSGAITGFSPTTLYFGDNGGAGGDVHMDQFIFSNDYARDLYLLKDATEYPL